MNSDQKDAIVNQLVKEVNFRSGELPSTFSESVVFSGKLPEQTISALKKVGQIGSLKASNFQVPSVKSDKFELCFSPPFFFFFYDKSKKKFFEKPVPSEFKSFFNNEVVKAVEMLEDISDDVEALGKEKKQKRQDSLKTNILLGFKKTVDSLKKVETEKPESGSGGGGGGGGKRPFPFLRGELTPEETPRDNKSPGPVKFVKRPDGKKTVGKMSLSGGGAGVKGGITGSSSLPPTAGSGEDELLKREKRELEKFNTQIERLRKGEELEKQRLRQLSGMTQKEYDKEMLEYKTSMLNSEMKLKEADFKNKNYEKILENELKERTLRLEQAAIQAELDRDQAKLNKRAKEGIDEETLVKQMKTDAEINIQKKDLEAKKAKNEIKEQSKMVEVEEAVAKGQDTKEEKKKLIQLMKQKKELDKQQELSEITKKALLIRQANQNITKDEFLVEAAERLNKELYGAPGSKDREKLIAEQKALMKESIEDQKKISKMEADFKKQDLNQEQLRRKYDLPTEEEIKKSIESKKKFQEGEESIRMEELESRKTIVPLQNELKKMEVDFRKEDMDQEQLKRKYDKLTEEEIKKSAESKKKLQQGEDEIRLKDVESRKTIIPLENELKQKKLENEKKYSVFENWKRSALQEIERRDIEEQKLRKKYSSLSEKEVKELIASERKTKELKDEMDRIQMDINRSKQLYQMEVLDLENELDRRRKQAALDNVETDMATENLSKQLTLRQKEAELDAMERGAATRIQREKLENEILVLKKELDMQDLLDKKETIADRALERAKAIEEAADKKARETIEEERRKSAEEQAATGKILKNVISGVNSKMNNRLQKIDQEIDKKEKLVEANKSYLLSKVNDLNNIVSQYISNPELGSLPQSSVDYILDVQDYINLLDNISTSFETEIKHALQTSLLSDRLSDDDRLSIKRDVLEQFNKMVEALYPKGKTSLNLGMSIAEAKDQLSTTSTWLEEGKLKTKVHQNFNDVIEKSINKLDEFELSRKANIDIGSFEIIQEFDEGLQRDVAMQAEGNSDYSPFKLAQFKTTVNGLLNVISTLRSGYKSVMRSYIDQFDKEILKSDVAKNSEKIQDRLQDVDAINEILNNPNISEQTKQSLVGVLQNKEGYERVDSILDTLIKTGQQPKTIQDIQKEIKKEKETLIKRDQDARGRLFQEKQTGIQKMDLEEKKASDPNMKKVRGVLINSSVSIMTILTYLNNLLKEATKTLGKSRLPYDRLVFKLITYMAPNPTIQSYDKLYKVFSRYLTNAGYKPDDWRVFSQAVVELDEKLAKRINDDDVRYLYTVIQKNEDTFYEDLKNTVSAFIKATLSAEKIREDETGVRGIMDEFMVFMMNEKKYSLETLLKSVLNEFNSTQSFAPVYAEVLREIGQNVEKLLDAKEQEQIAQNEAMANQNIGAQDDDYNAFAVAYNAQAGGGAGDGGGGGNQLV